MHGAFFPFTVAGYQKRHIRKQHVAMVEVVLKHNLSISFCEEP